MQADYAMLLDMPDSTSSDRVSAVARQPDDAPGGSPGQNRTEFGFGGLYDGFEAYRTPTVTDYEKLLTSEILVLDTNVLIDLYRYHQATRNDFIVVLESLKELIWLPNQVIKEFWKNRDNIIRDPREVDKTTRELNKHLASAEKDLRFWAKRVRLPSDRVEGLSGILTAAFGKVVGEVQELAVDDGREFARDTNRDPLMLALDPILRDRVGEPLEHDEYERALVEAQRRGKAQIPPGYMDTDKEGLGPTGDYLLWAQLLKEAERRQKDVLFVTSDNKEDWWRKDKDGESLGPRPELVEELRSLAGVRLFMLPPDGLLDRARSVLKLPVSEESVQDVKQVSGQIFGGSGQISETQPDESLINKHLNHQIYTQELRLAILRMGYRVSELSAIDRGFDIVVQDTNDWTIYIEIKYSNNPSGLLTEDSVLNVIDLTSRTRVPVLLVTNMPLTKLAEETICESPDIEFVIWRDETDSGHLEDKLRETFAQLM